MPAFCITEDVQSDGLAILAVSGEIDFEVSPRLRGCIDGHIKSGHARLMLDLLVPGVYSWLQLPSGPGRARASRGAGAGTR